MNKYIIINGEKYNNIGDYCAKQGISLECFNQPVIIPEGVKDCSSMFQWCESFNQPVIIPKGVKDCSSMFSDCTSFNQPIIIPESVEDCSSMFAGCKSFNQPIIIPEGMDNCNFIFYNCTSFNQPVTIPEGVESCLYMFYNCKSFNQPVTIPEGVEDCSYMFYNCKSFNQPIIIPKSVNGYLRMFTECCNFTESVVLIIGKKKDIYIFDNQRYLINGKEYSNEDLPYIKFKSTDKIKIDVKCNKIIVENEIDAFRFKTATFTNSDIITFKINGNIYRKTQLKNFRINKNDKFEYDKKTKTLTFFNEIDEARIAKSMINRALS